MTKISKPKSQPKGALTNRETIHVQWGDCDPAGIVYYPRYFAYFDNCTAALFARAGLPKQEMFQRYGIVGIPMVDTRAQFIAPCRFGDDVVVESTISQWGRSSFHVHHRLLKQKSLAVECFEIRVWAIRSGEGPMPRPIKSQAIPEEVKLKFLPGKAGANVKRSPRRAEPPA